MMHYIINSLNRGFNYRLGLFVEGKEQYFKSEFLFFNDLNLLKFQSFTMIFLFISNIVLIFFLYFLFKALNQAFRNHIKKVHVFTSKAEFGQHILSDFDSEGHKHLHFKLDDNIFTPQEKRKIAMLQMNLRADDKWEVFKKWFNENFPDFYLKLRERYPSLTAGDFRLLSLIKLNLSNKDMAMRLGISIEGVKKSKQRLKKKLGIDLEDLVEEVC